MRKLSVFNNFSTDGYFTDARGDMSWAKTGNDDEFNQFTSENASRGGMLVFGRVTYDLMAGFWPSLQAAQAMPVVAERMNNLPKIVFSKKLTAVAWNNTTLVKDDLADYIWKMKKESGPSMVILGSGSIVAQLTDAGLIDEYQIVLNPIALGAGRTIFDAIKKPLDLKLTQMRAFKNGKIYLRYEPA